MKKRFFLCAFLGLFTLAFLGKDALISKGAALYVKRSLRAEGWSYETFKEDKNTFSIDKVSYTGPLGHVEIDAVFAEFHCSIFPLFLEPKVHVRKLVMDLAADKPSQRPLNGVWALLLDPRIRPHIEVEDGQVSGILEAPLYFSLTQGPGDGDLVSVTLEDLNHSPFLQASLGRKEGDLFFQSEVISARAEDIGLLAMQTGLVTSEEMSHPAGEVSGRVCARITKHIVSEVKGSFDFQGFGASFPKINTHLLSHNMKGTFYLPKESMNSGGSLWKKASGFLTFEDAHVKIETKDSNLGIEEALGELRINPDKDPYLKVGGKLLSQKDQIPFRLEGRGRFEDSGLYSVGARADFTLGAMHPRIQGKWSKMESDTAEADVQLVGAVPEIFNLFEHLSFKWGFPALQMTQGDLSGRFKARFHGSSLTSVEVLDLEAKRAKFERAMEEETFGAEELKLSAFIEKGTKERWTLKTLGGSLRSGSVDAKRMTLSDLGALFRVEEGNLEALKVEGSYCGMRGCITSLEPESGALFHLDVQASAPDLLAQILPEQERQNISGLVKMSMDLKPQESQLRLDSLVTIESLSGTQEKVHVEALVNHRLSKSIDSLLTRWDLSTLKGTFEAKELSFETLEPITRPWLGSLSPKGFVKGEGAFGSSGIDLNIHAADVSVSDGSLDLRALLGHSSGEARLSYNFQEGFWKGSIALDELQVHSRLLQLSAQVQDSLILLEGGKLWSDRFHVKAQGVEGEGKMMIDPQGLHLTSHSIEASLASLATYFPQIKGFDRGSFKAREGDLWLNVKKGEKGMIPRWGVSVQLEEGCYDLGSKGRIEDIKARMHIDSEGQTSFEGISAVFKRDLSGCDLFLSDLSFNVNHSIKAPFSFQAKQGSRVWAKVDGFFETKDSETCFTLEPSTEILGLKLQVEPFSFKQKTLSPLILSSQFDLGEIPHALAMWKEVGLPEIDTSYLGLCSGQTRVVAKCDLQRGFWKVSVVSPEVSRAGQVLGPFNALISGVKASARIESMKVGTTEALGTLDLSGPIWKAQKLQIKTPSMLCQFRAEYESKTQSLSIPSFQLSWTKERRGALEVEGQFSGVYASLGGGINGSGDVRLKAKLPSSFGLELLSARSIPFSFEGKKGVQTGELLFDLLSSESSEPLGTLTAEKASYHMGGERLLVEGMDLEVPQECFEEIMTLPFFEKHIEEVKIHGALKLKGSMDLSKESSYLIGHVESGAFQVFSHPLSVKDLAFTYDVKTLKAKGEITNLEKPFFADLAFTGNELEHLQATLFESVETRGLEIFASKEKSKPWLIEKAQGTLWGVDLKAEKDTDYLVYTLEAGINFNEAVFFYLNTCV